MEDVPTGGVREGQDLSGSDIESINGVSDAEGEDIREPVAPTNPQGWKPEPDHPFGCSRVWTLWKCSTDVRT